MEWILSQLANERRMIEGAPLHFALAVLLTSLLGWLLLRFLYLERINSLTQIVGLYKDRYGSLDIESKTQFGKLSNSQLKRKVGQIANGVDELAIKFKTGAEGHNTQNDFAQNAATPVGIHTHVSAVYVKDFKEDAILLRAEMLSRLSNHGLKDPGPATSGMGPLAFDHPTNAFGYREVSSELRRLAKLLP